MVLDELFAWNLVDDPSWHHALHAWYHGVDGGGFLFYASLWPLVRASGGSVLLARLASATTYFLAAIVWWRALTRFIESRWAAVGVLLVWVSSELLLGYVYMIRFYALYLLLSALAVYTLLRAAEGSWSRLTSGVLIFLVNACLVLTHMIGIMYSGLVLGAWLLCVGRRRRLWVMAVPLIAGWGTLWFCRTAIRASALNYGYSGMPHPRDFLRFYLKSAISWPVLLLAGIGCVLLLRDLARHLREDRDTSRLTILAPVLCLVYLLSPLGLYAICVLSKPIAAVRYLLPYYLSLATLCAYALQQLAARLKTAPAWMQRSAACALALTVLLLHRQAVQRLPPPPQLSLATLQGSDRNTPLVVEDEEVFFQLQHYFSGPGQQFYFLIAPRGTPAGLMGTVAVQGYYPGHIVPADTFTAQRLQFLLLASHRHATSPWYPNPDRCEMRILNRVQVHGFLEDLYSVSSCPPL